MPCDDNDYLLIVCNRPSANTRALASAVVDGARSAVDKLDIRFRDPLEASPADVLGCRGILIGSTENFGAMAGLVKDFFERIYYPCLEQTQGLPVAIYIRAGLDGTGTEQGILRITTGLRWKPVCPPLLLKGEWQTSFVEEARELGQLLSAGVDAGIF